MGLSDSVCGAGDYSVRARPLSRWHTANAEMVDRVYERALYMLGGSSGCVIRFVVLYACSAAVALIRVDICVVECSHDCVLVRVSIYA